MDEGSITTLLNFLLRIMPSPIGYSTLEEGIQDGLAYFFLFVGIATGQIRLYAVGWKWAALASFIVFVALYALLWADPSWFRLSTALKSAASLSCGFLSSFARQSEEADAGPEPQAPAAAEGEPPTAAVAADGAPQHEAPHAGAGVTDTAPPPPDPGEERGVPARQPDPATAPPPRKARL